MAVDGRLADGAVDLLVMFWGRPAPPAVLADGEGPQVRRIPVPHAQQQGAVGQLDRFALVHVTLDVPAELERLSAVVAVERVGAAYPPSLRLVLDAVVAREDEPALVRPASKLDAVPGPGGVPGPVALLDLRGDLRRCRPRTPVIVAAGHEDAVVVAGERQDDSSAAAIDDRAGVSDGDLLLAALLVDDLLLRPGRPAVLATADQQVDVARVGAAGLAPLAEGQQRSLGRGRQRGDAVGVVAALSAGEQDLFERFPRRLAGQRPAQKGQGDGGPSQSHGKVRVGHRILPISCVLLIERSAGRGITRFFHDAGRRCG